MNTTEGNTIPPRNPFQEKLMEILVSTKTATISVGVANTHVRILLANFPVHLPFRISLLIMLTQERCQLQYLKYDIIVEFAFSVDLILGCQLYSLLRFSFRHRVGASRNRAIVLSI